MQIFAVRDFMLKRLLTISALALCLIACQDKANSQVSTISKDGADKNGSILEVDFAVKANADQMADFKDGIVPWASIKDAQQDVSRLVDADTVIIQANTATLNIDYPVKTPVSFKITSENGFTKAEILEKVSQTYQEMYATEEATSTIKTTPMAQRKGLINRNETDGKYGIWGHDIDDLDLSHATINCKNNECVIDLGIES
jgi:hypothetical protein